MSPGNVEGDLKSQKLDEVVDKEVTKVEEVNKELVEEFNDKEADVVVANVVDE